MEKWGRGVSPPPSPPKITTLPKPTCCGERCWPICNRFWSCRDGEGGWWGFSRCALLRWNHHLGIRVAGASLGDLDALVAGEGQPAVGGGATRRDPCIQSTCRERQFNQVTGAVRKKIHIICYCYNCAICYLFGWLEINVRPKLFHGSWNVVNFVGFYPLVQTLVVVRKTKTVYFVVVLARYFYSSM